MAGYLKTNAIWGPFALILSFAHCAVTKELTSGRGTCGTPLWIGLSCEQWLRELCMSTKLAPRGGDSLPFVSQDRQEEWKQHYQRIVENPFFLFQVKFPKYCSSINQAGARWALFSAFQKEMVCWRVIPQHGFISFSCWDVLARSSPLVYWLQTICDCRGLWLLSPQKQGMQSIHEKHRTFFFLLKNVYLFLLAFLGTET